MEVFERRFDFSLKAMAKNSHEMHHSQVRVFSGKNKSYIEEITILEIFTGETRSFDHGYGKTFCYVPSNFV